MPLHVGKRREACCANAEAVRSAPAILGYGVALAIALGAFSYTGGKLNGYQRDTTVDEVARKEYLRKNRRRPIEEIANELGEGRGEFHVPAAFELTGVRRRSVW